MNSQDGLVLYHKCGRTVVQDADGTFRGHDDEREGESILVCPTCGAVLRDRDLYSAKSDIAREKLRDVGWYPDLGGLALLDEPERRAAIVSALKAALDDMGDADLLAAYAVVMGLRDQEGG